MNGNYNSIFDLDDDAVVACLSSAIHINDETKHITVKPR